VKSFEMVANIILRLIFTSLMFFFKGSGLAKFGKIGLLFNIQGEKNLNHYSKVNVKSL
jgi:hypothetical protein